jgi:hypothetical protein
MSARPICAITADLRKLFALRGTMPLLEAADRLEAIQKAFDQYAASFSLQKRSEAIRNFRAAITGHEPPSAASSDPLGRAPHPAVKRDGCSGASSPEGGAL